MKDFLNYVIFSMGDFSLKVTTVIKVLIVLVIVVVILKIVKASIYKVERFDNAKKYSIYTLTKYIIVVFATVIAFQTIGFNIAVLIGGSAALLVGLGLGMQNLFSDYISGLIILIESSIKVGDILEINGLVCKVQEIELRTTTVFTRDGKYITLPNTDFTRNHLINWTHNEISSRFDVSVGVDYNSDVDQVMALLKQVAVEFDQIRKDPMPFVRFEDFGESALVFTVFFWSDEIFRIENIRSEYRVRLFREFNTHNITIPFPQHVIRTPKE